MNTFIKKVTSRKLWLAIANFVVMLMIYKGAADETAEQVFSIIMAGGGMMAYIFAEGFADGNNKDAE